MDNETINLIVQADAALEKINVQSDDVFRMADARRLMRAAFNRLRNLTPKEEKSEVENNG